MTAREIVLKFPVLHPAQEVIRASKARYRVLACGRRFGKTLVITDEGVEMLALGKRVGYFNLSYGQGKEVWEDFKRLAKPITSHKDESARRIETITGGVLEMWSLDNEETAKNSRGRKYDLVIIDEAAFIPILLSVWDKVIQPMLMDTQGRALFSSSPNGLNDFYTLFQRGKDPLKKNWQSFQYPTSANPHIRQEEIDQSRADKPDQAFRQEILAEFMADGSGVFRGTSDIADVPIPSPVTPGMRYVMGVDWGRQADFTAIVVFEVETMTMVDIDRFNRIGWEYQRDRLKQMMHKWGITYTLAEQNSIGDVNIDALHSEGLPVDAFQTTALSKPPLIENLASAIEKKQIRLQPDPVLLNELNAYTMKRSSTGRWQYDAPSGGHDDTVLALALAYEAALRNQSRGLPSWVNDYRGG